MKEIKPQFRNLNDKSDLEKMNIGDFTNCEIEGFLSKINPKNGIAVYEGPIDDEDSFITQKQESEDIISFRIQRIYLSFNKRVVLNSSFIKPMIYTENSSRYKSARQLLINAAQWRN